MGRTDEVVPDSQDEAELLVPEPVATVLERDQSPPAEQYPLINATTSSSQTASSYALPRPERIQHTAASTISQFTSETPATTASAAPSTISAFSSSGPAKKSRPKPRPTFAGAAASKDTSTRDIRNAISPAASLPVSTAAPAPHAPPPEPTFSADISERIKARRARPAAGSTLPEPAATQEKARREAKGKKKTALAVEAVVDISSDEELRPGPARPPAASTHPTKPNDAPECPDPLNLGIPTRHIPSAVLHEVDDGSISPIPSRKRKRHVAAVSPDLGPSMPRAAVTLGGMDAGGAHEPHGDQDTAPPRKKKTKKTKRVVDDAAYDDLPTGKPKKKKAKAKDNGPEPQKSHAKTKVKEKEHFKSSEFILDSDDELGLKAGDGGIGPLASISAAPVVASASPQAPLAVEFGTRPGLVELEAYAGVGPEKPTGGASEKTKTSSKKRKAVAEAPDEEPANGAGESPLKRTKHLSEGGDLNIIMGREKRHGARANSVLSTDTANDTNGAEQKPDVPQVKAKRKRGRMIVEDEGEDDAKENLPRHDRRTATSKALEPTAPPLSKLLPKPACIYPPKNRPLSAILQVVNGSSPRPRASPAVSRSLLCRIAPLHPNRRTPPPPPPPRIIPKKTKKELEREEKWEEELQETVEGWCELGGEERDRMRRAKRDWEMGLCE